MYGKIVAVQRFGLVLGQVLLYYPGTVVIYARTLALYVANSRYAAKQTQVPHHVPLDCPLDSTP